MAPAMNRPLLSVDNLSVRLTHSGRTVTPVDAVSFSLAAGEALGIVGESGSGKSLTLRAVLGLLPPGGEIDGSICFDRTGARTQTRNTAGVLASTASPERTGPDGARRPGIGMIFQEPMTALNPTMRVGDLIAEGARNRAGLSRRAARQRAVELLSAAGVPEPDRRARMWPHQLSGGLRQRVMIAAALSTDPALLLCDEPTTALDVTIQDQILALLTRLRHDLAMAILFVSHDLAVVAEVCDRIAVMYAGRIVETGTVDDVLTRPRHPYTAALLASAPSLHEAARTLAGIGGRPPDPRAFPPGCRFAPRCGFAREDCLEASPRLTRHGAGATACIHPDVLTAGLT
jgi:oligopeptide/dipeptide ABC transporter ATP-binding protein